MSRVAVVTGGASGHGRSDLPRARQARTQGRRARPQRRSGATGREDLRADGVTALGVAADVSDRAAVEEAFAKVRTELGPVHILVTSAGAVDFAPFTDITHRRPGSG